MAAGDQFIVAKSVQIKTGYGNTSEQYRSYDFETLDQQWDFEKRNCFQRKMSQYQSTFKGLRQDDYEYTVTETYINTLPTN